MLGEQFKFDLDASKALDSNIIKGEKYRFTILSDRLIRLEFSENGEFVDLPSELVWHRNMPKVEYNLKEDKRTLEITTKYFRLRYVKNKKHEYLRLCFLFIVNHIMISKR